MKKRLSHLAALMYLGVIGGSAGTEPGVSSPTDAASIETGLQISAPCFAWQYCAAPNCVPLPTSLPAVSAALPGEYESAGGNCGTKTCYVILRCPCGPPLASGYCRIKAR